MQLTKEEEAFLKYWSAQRLRKKQFLRKYSIGLPLGVAFVLALLVNLLSGWYEGADIELRKHSSVIIVILVAAVGIVAFFIVFSVRHKWDQNELHYQELLAKKERA